MSSLAVVIPMALLIGVPILVVWGLVRQRRELLSLRSRARARGYEAEHATRYRGKDGVFEWTATVIGVDDGFSSSHDSPSVETPSMWHFTARWLPAKAVLENAATLLVDARTERAQTVAAASVWFTFNEPTRAEIAHWHRVDRTRIYWTREEGVNSLAVDLRAALVEWMTKERAENAVLRHTPYTFEFAAKFSPIEPSEAEFAEFIAISLDLCNGWARSDSREVTQL